MSQEKTKDMSQYFYRASAADFMKIPGSPVAYWVDEIVRHSFLAGESFESLATPRQGLGTGNNSRFTRLWYEIDRGRLTLGCASKSDALASKAKWFPYTKGGGFKKWYGNEIDVVNWENDGAEIRLALKGMNPNIPRSEEHYFKKGITWGLITSANFSARITDAGAIFDVGGSKAMPSEENYFPVLGILNSKISGFLLKTLNPTLNFQVGDLKKLPIVGLHKQQNLKKLVQRLVDISKADWNSKETSLGFITAPILSYNKNKIAEAWAELMVHEKNLIEEVKKSEFYLNRELISIYGLEGTLNPEISPAEVSLECNPAYIYRTEDESEKIASRFRSERLSELISFSIGLMFGRYSLDREGLVYAKFGNKGFSNLVAEGAFKTFPADEDGVIPLTDQEWFADDATNRFREFVRVVWGDEHLQENLDFVAESLCLHAIKPKRGESALDTIRRYLSTQFYKDHMRTYKKRPIYWLFSSGKHKAFECLVYLHRYNDGTLARMRTEYVIPLTAKLTAYADKLEQDKAASASAAETKRLEKEINTLHKQQAELAEFDEKLRHYADQRIALDLDDGVKVNYGKFGDLLADVKVVTGVK